MKEIRGINKAIKTAIVEGDNWKEKDIFWAIRDENITYKRFKKIMSWLERNNWILYDGKRKEYVWIYAGDNPKLMKTFSNAVPL